MLVLGGGSASKGIYLLWAKGLCTKLCQFSLFTMTFASGQAFICDWEIMVSIFVPRAESFETSRCRPCVHLPKSIQLFAFAPLLSSYPSQLSSFHALPLEYHQVNHHLDLFLQSNPPGQNTRSSLFHPRIDAALAA